jgi:hypothetical protein
MSDEWLLEDGGKRILEAVSTPGYFWFFPI